MSFNVEKRNQIKNNIINLIGEGMNCIEMPVRFNAAKFAQEHNLSVQTIYRYLDQLQKDGVIIKSGAEKSASYKLRSESQLFYVNLSEKPAEDVIWANKIQPLLKNVPQNAYQICNYAFTELLNNAIEHSEGTRVDINVVINAKIIKILIHDNGVGIFSKIADALKLEEKRFAILELAKGKFTTDPDSHTGEGIFFSSKVTDFFWIYSDGMIYSPLDLPENNIDSMLIDSYDAKKIDGTVVFFIVRKDSKLTVKEVFNSYSGIENDYGFNKTMVPVILLEYGNDSALYISRSQAKRLMLRFEKFKNIVLDFSGIKEIGQGFADEIFRVFAQQHPDCIVTAHNCSQQVQSMINRIKNAL